MSFNRDQSQKLISLQHELLMSIDIDKSPDDLLKEFSFKAIKILNLKRIHFLQKNNKNAGVRKKTFSIPPSALNVIDEHPKLKYYVDQPSPKENGLIEELQYDDSYFYCFSTKSFGFFIVEKRVTPVEDILIQALIPAITRFSMAYLSRCQFELNEKKSHETKKISSALKLDNRKFTTILEAIKDGVIAINVKKEIFFANKSAYKIMGIENNTTLGKKYYDYFRLLNIDESIDVTQELEALAVQENTWETNEPVRFKVEDDKSKICEINVQKIRDRRKENTFYYVVTFHDVTETYEMEQTLAWQATHDYLTQCFNRSGFEHKLNQLITKNTSDNHALIYMDLDRFKYVNDLGGHIAGDALLKQISEMMQHEIRDTDYLARVGGDEFCIITMHCKSEYAIDLAERIRGKIERLRFQWNENVFTVGISLGVATIKPEDKDADTVFFRADDACIFSKNNGRNQVTLAHENTHNLSKRDANAQINYLNCVNNSLAANDSTYNFVLYHQTIKALAKDQKDHIEVLLRMEHKEKMIPPNAFLPTAERYGKIVDIDLWVVKNSLAYIKNCEGIDVNVNLSGITLSDDDARKQLYDLISKHPNEAKRLCLEITETVAITNLAKTISFMKKTSQYGVSFALDDFGTGVSSFGYLKNLPVKYLKIDGSFIRDICNNKIDQIVVRSITEAAKAMSIQTVAEYVEDEEILALLTDIGVDFVQGYHLNKPERLLVANA